MRVMGGHSNILLMIFRKMANVFLSVFDLLLRCYIKINAVFFTHTFSHALISRRMEILPEPVETIEFTSKGQN